LGGRVEKKGNTARTCKIIWLIFFRHHDRKRRDAVIRRAVLDLIGLGIVESSLAWS